MYLECTGVRNRAFSRGFTIEQAIGIEERSLDYYADKVKHTTISKNIKSCWNRDASYRVALYLSEFKDAIIKDQIYINSDHTRHPLIKAGECTGKTIKDWNNMTKAERQPFI